MVPTPDVGLTPGGVIRVAVGGPTPFNPLSSHGGGLGVVDWSMVEVMEPSVWDRVYRFALSLP